MSAAKKGEGLSSPHGLAPRAGADRTISFQCQLVRNSRYQQLAEGIKRTDRRELKRHQMGFAEWQLLQHGVRCLSVDHIEDEDDTRPVFQRIPLVDLAIEIELRGLANLGRQNALN